MTPEPVRRAQSLPSCDRLCERCASEAAPRISRRIHRLRAIESSCEAYRRTQRPSIELEMERARLAAEVTGLQAGCLDAYRGAAAAAD